MKSGAGSSWMVAVLSSTAAARKSARASRNRGRSWEPGHGVSSGWQHRPGQPQPLPGLCSAATATSLPGLCREQSWERLLPAAVLVSRTSDPAVPEARQQRCWPSSALA